MRNLNQIQPYTFSDLELSRVSATLIYRGIRTKFGGKLGGRGKRMLESENPEFVNYFRSRIDREKSCYTIFWGKKLKVPVGQKLPKLNENELELAL